MSRLRAFLSRPSGQIVAVVLVLLLSLAVRIALFRFEGCEIDAACFTAWFRHAAANGFHHFYETTWCDYPPFNVYIFWVFGKLAQAVGGDSLSFIIKLPQNLFDLGTAYLIFIFLRQRFSFRFSFAVMAIYAFNPATIFDLAVWGQMDSIYTFFMVASLYSVLKSRYEVSGGLFALAILTKPQSVILLPVLAYVILRNGGWRRALTSSAVFVVLVYLLILPFNWDNPVAFLIDRYSGYGVYPYNSVNAYNLWALFGFWKNDTVSHLGLTYQQWGVLLFVLFAGFVMWQLHRRYTPRSAVYAAFLLALGFFMLMTRMHERYLFPVFALLAMGASPRSSLRLTLFIYAGLTLTYLANLAYVLHNLNAEPTIFIPDGHWSIYVLVPINVFLLGLAVWLFYHMQRRPRTPPEVRPGLPRAPDEVEEEAQPPPRWRGGTLSSS